MLAANEKGLLESEPGAGPVQTCIGGLMLNQLGWAALFGIPVGVCGRQADGEAGRRCAGRWRDTASRRASI